MTRDVALFRFFASFKFAISLLIVLGITLAVGTVIESRYGTSAAQLLVYHTFWFEVLLILVALSLAASAVDRLPWKKRHAGFLTTHLGIILILFGSLVSQAFGIEGQLQIREGETAGRMLLTKRLLEVKLAGSSGRWTFLLPGRVFPWSGTKALEAEGQGKVPFKVRVLTDYPEARVQESVREGANGPAAVHFVLQGGMADAEQWLVLDDPEAGRLAMGPAVIRFASTPIPQAAPSTAEGSGRLMFRFGKGEAVAFEIDPEKIGNQVSLAGTPYQVTVKRVIKDASVSGRELIERSEEWRNPAVQFELEGEAFKELHTVFANFPDFPTVHGLKASQSGAKIIYEAPGMMGSMPKNELRFIPAGNHGLDYQVKRGPEITRGRVELGKEVETGWMDFKFKVDQYLEHARWERTYVPLPPSAKAPAGTVPAVQIQFEASGERRNIWLVQGEINHVAAGGLDLHVIYGLLTQPLDFQLKLNDFIMDTNPGTRQPASFKSEVTLKDASRGIQRDVLIQMNEPLKHRGYKIYQSAYQQTPGEPDISIFSVARDPGNPLKYIGTIVMTGGIIMLFYIRPLSTLKTSDPRTRQK